MANTLAKACALSSLPCVTGWCMPLILPSLFCLLHRPEIERAAKGPERKGVHRVSGRSASREMFGEISGRRGRGRRGEWGTER